VSTHRGQGHSEENYSSAVGTARMIEIDLQLPAGALRLALYWVIDAMPLYESDETLLRRYINRVLRPLSLEGAGVSPFVRIGCGTPLVSICGCGGQGILPSGAAGIAFECRVVARSGASGARPRECLCRDLAGGVFSHVVAAGLDPDGVVHDAVHDRVGVDSRTEALVPVFLGVLGAEHR